LFSALGNQLCGRKQILQYPPVLTEAVIDVAHIIITIAVKAVVMCVAAIIITEFFISPPMQAALTAEAGFGDRKHKLD
jgi:hypothetical protein